MWGRLVSGTRRIEAASGLLGAHTVLGRGRHGLAAGAWVAASGRRWKRAGARESRPGQAEKGERAGSAVSEKKARRAGVAGWLSKPDGRLGAGLG